MSKKLLNLISDLVGFKPEIKDKMNMTVESDGNIYMRFGGPCTYIRFDPDLAEAVAAELIKGAKASRQIHGKP